MRKFLLTLSVYAFSYSLASAQTATNHSIVDTRSTDKFMRMGSWEQPLIPGQFTDEKLSQ